MIAKKLKQFLLFYLPVLLWMGFIFYLSSIPNLKTGADSIQVEIILRKIAHLGEYAILGFLLARIFKQLHGLPAGSAYVVCLLLVAAFAAGDEWHQHFVSNRAGRAADVGVDFIGGVFGVAAFGFLQKIFNFPK